MDMRVFWAVLAAFGVAGVVMLLHQQYQDYRAQRALEQFVATLPQYTQSDVWQQQRSVDPRAAAELAARRARQLALAGDEQCIGGTVIRVAGSSYTQVLGPDLRPVACAGRSRLAAH